MALLPKRKHLFMFGETESLGFFWVGQRTPGETDVQINEEMYMSALEQHEKTAL